jgi:DNA-binding transcriptional LysR family regulator
VAVRPRGPVRAAVLPLVTVSLYGFWWWWDVGWPLRVLGRPADPGRVLAAVTVGWFAVVPPFRSVHRTTAMIAAAGGGVAVAGADGLWPRWLVHLYLDRRAPRPWPHPPPIPVMHCKQLRGIKQRAERRPSLSDRKGGNHS